ncbi:MAG TPA: hypothetical protein VNC41_17090, partial [Acidimicrobiia bacterium]|nr:hypothetical protein [Acidimicrobiia bacterium]
MSTRFELPGFSGMLVHPEDAGYDETRAVFNGMIDRKPAVIAQCTSADDVVAAVNYARENALPLSVYGGMLAFPAERGAEILRAYREFVADAPDEVGSGLAFVCAPPEDFVPPEVQGQPIVGVVCCYAGPVEDGENAYKPMRDLGPALDLVGPMPYVALQSLLDGGAIKGMQNYWTADFYGELPDEAVDTLAGIATKPISPLTQIIVVPGGGAVARVRDDDTAFGERTAKFNIHYLSMWADPAETPANIAYTKDLNNAMKPWSTGGVYLNFIGDEGQARVESGFSAAKWQKLR